MNPFRLFFGLTLCLTPAIASAQFNFLGIEGGYVEVQTGQAQSGFSGLDFVNPAGAASPTIVSATNGNNIILSSVDSSDKTTNLGLTVAGVLENNVVLSASFQKFNNLVTSGDATFNVTSFIATPPFFSTTPTNYEQKLTTSGQGIFLGAGYKLDFGPVFVEPKLELGYARNKTTGTQGANLSAGNPFPENTDTSFVPGISLSGGYKILPNTHLVGTLNHRDYGKITTGTTGSSPPAGMNTGERLETDLKITSINIGLRFSF